MLIEDTMDAPLPQLARGRRLKPDVCLVQIQDGALNYFRKDKICIFVPLAIAASKIKKLLQNIFFNAGRRAILIMNQSLRHLKLQRKER